MNNDNYPQGAEFDPKAPYNQKEFSEEEIEVTVSITLSKNFKIRVKDYMVSDEGEIDFSECDLKSAVEEQIILPHKAYVLTSGPFEKDLKGYIVDDFEVILDK